MATYDWRWFEEAIVPPTLERLAERYDRAVGAQRVSAWHAFVRDLQGFQDRADTDEGQQAISTLTDRFLEQPSEPGAKKKTVFVSHQRLDADWAERAAYEASELGLDYWLDIHDLAVGQSTTKNPLHPAIHAALIAGAIEMALLNCTHIVSLQTVNSRASRWVPYELGRAKARITIATNAGSWFQSGVWLDPGGDYLALTYCAKQDVDLYAWLQGVAGRTTPLHPNQIWRGVHNPPKHHLPN
jgi:hypothetical protein